MNRLNLFSKLQDLIISTILILSPVFYGILRTKYSFGEGIFYGLLMGLAGSCILIFKLAKHKSVKHYGINIVDILFFLYLTYGAVHSLVRSQFIDEYIYIKWGCLAFLYILFRFYGKLNKVWLGLVIAGLLQCLIGAMQVFGVIGSSHSQFAMTGSFGNPGQLGGFLSLCFIASVVVVDWSHIKLKYSAFYISSSALLFVFLILSESRSGLIASAIGCSIIFFKQLKKFVIARKIMTLGLSVVILLCLFVLFNLKRDSVEGRLLIWNTTLRMIAEMPVTGHGINSFANKYMMYQAGYFANHPDSKFTMVADNPIYVYNEFLHIVSEQGVIGFAILLTLLSACLKYGNKNLVGLLSAWLAFSLFSYPTAVPPLLILLVIFMAFVKPPVVICLNNTYILKIFMSCLCVSCLIIAYNTKNSAVTLSNNTRNLFKIENDDARRYFDVNFVKLSHNTAFRNIYSVYLEYMPDEDHLLMMPPSYHDYLTLGKLYYETDNMCKALDYFNICKNMIPNRLTPVYFIWKCSLEAENIDSYKLAQEVINHIPKVENIKTKQMKYEALIFLANQSNNAQSK